MGGIKHENGWYGRPLPKKKRLLCQQTGKQKAFTTVLLGMFSYGLGITLTGNRKSIVRNKCFRGVKFFGLVTWEFTKQSRILSNYLESVPSKFNSPPPQMSLYLESSKIIARVNYGGLRAAVYSDRSIKSKPEQLYALCVETLKHQEILNEVIEKSQILKVEKKVNPPLEGAKFSSQVLTFP